MSNNDQKTEKQTSFYNERNASTYDQIRFSSPSGKVIDELEGLQLARSIDFLKAGSKILEIGAGTARFSIDLAKRGFEVTALEPSTAMLAKAKEKARGLQNIAFVEAPGEDTGLPPNTFDLVFSTRVLNRLLTKETAIAVIEEKIRVCKPGGLISIDFASSEFLLKRPATPVVFSCQEVRDIATRNNCSVIRTNGMFILGGSFVSKLPKPLLPAWKKLEIGISNKIVRRSSKVTMILKKQ
ncbi:class I SAM-dependent methyltransferase [Wenzhouxiangella sp. EGI_FJ10305]|uniref:class I SAM-dependent methyltransferase n=1 Tax=Wenzhouxiangella sp. EGI_FJ10305 TaxID=3243768 RepID=UPI0035D87A5B